MMSNSIQETDAPSADHQHRASSDPTKLWCNFCGFESDELVDYLAHSCVTVLEQKGQTVVPTGQNECR